MGRKKAKLTGPYLHIMHNYVTLVQVFYNIQYINTIIIIIQYLQCIIHKYNHYIHYLQCIIHKYNHYIQYVTMYNIYNTIIIYSILQCIILKINKLFYNMLDM